MRLQTKQVISLLLKLGEFLLQVDFFLIRSNLILLDDLPHDFILLLEQANHAILILLPLHIRSLVRLMRVNHRIRNQSLIRKRDIIHAQLIKVAKQWIRE